MRRPACDCDCHGGATDLSNNSCGLTESALDTSVRFILSQSRIRIAPGNGASDYVYLNVNILPNCELADYQLSVNSKVTVTTSNRDVYGAMIWRDGGLLSGASNTHDRIVSSVEEVVKEFVVDWSAANPNIP